MSMYRRCIPNRILALLETAPHAMTCSEMAEALEVPIDNIIDAVADLRSADKVQRFGDKGKYRYTLPIPLPKRERGEIPPVTAW